MTVDCKELEDEGAPRTSSPYFKNHHQPQTTKSSKRSSHFLLSPSSVHGSIQCLGPLVYTWATPDHPKSVPTICTRGKENETCPRCQAMIDQALLHFSSCSKFREQFSKASPKSSSLSFKQGIPCVEIVGTQMEQAVRHLCDSGCFLRAFAPCREWIFLRQTLSSLTDKPIGR